MDVVALVAVISSGLIGAGGLAAAFYSTRSNVTLARENRVQERKATAYLDVLRIIEREGLWVETVVNNFQVRAEGDGIFDAYLTVKSAPEPILADQATIAALVSAFGSQEVRDLCKAWGKTMDAFRNQVFAIHWNMDQDYGGAPDAKPSAADLQVLIAKLLPAEQTARRAVADTIARELGHR